MAGGKVKTAMIIPQKSPSNTKIKQSFTTIVEPFLEKKEISNRDSEIERSRTRIEHLESENQRLRDENEFLREELTKHNDKYQEKIKQMQSELSDIKRAIALVDDIDSSSPSAITTKLVDVTNTSNHKSNTTTAKCLRKCTTQSNTSVVLKSEIEVKKGSEDSMGIKRFRATRVPTPPPIPSASLLSSSSSSLTPSRVVEIPPPPAAAIPRSLPPPPPPPPLPLRAVPSPPKGMKAVPAKVRRVPEVVEFYHSFMKRDSNFRRDTGGGGSDSQAVGANAKDMIGEIENRSAHLLAIKRDVETQGDFIRFLIKEIEGAEFTDIEDVVPFVKWLDDELSYLVDERAVLKHFDWPEQKADALREAAFGYSDLKKLVSEASLFRYDPRQPCSPALKKMQSLFEKLEHGVHNLSRMRESATRRYKLLQIPVNWMMDTGYVSQIKLASVKLAMKYMKRVLAELEIVGGGPEEEELIVQGVKFAFRVHQFAGGFDVETMRVFQELRNKAQLCSVQCQNQNQQKIICRSSSAAY